MNPALSTKLLKSMPYWMQDLAVGSYNSRLYRERHRGVYAERQRYFSAWASRPREEVEEEAARRLREFLDYVCARSPKYKEFAGKPLDEFPIVEKQHLVSDLDAFATIKEGQGIVSLTGGTTGVSMKVRYTFEDMQERFALVDNFREAHGYRLGEKVAWFSGKDLATQEDVDRGRCYRDDRRNRIRFFSTFLINRRNFDSYWRALQSFQPRFLLGFPSSVLDIAMFAREKGLKADWEISAMFPNAETLLPVHREVIGEVFGCKLVDQYASAEGAPFIFECSRGRLHAHTLTGVFEVLDENGAHAQEGELVVTSFTTRGTPLIRYRIGDRMRFSSPQEHCGCGWGFPLVDWIDGRTSDFVYSPETGRINLGNLSNCTKDVEGILSFQVQQDEVTSILVRVVSDRRFDVRQEARFMNALRARTGEAMEIKIEQVDDIPRERSGKFRIIKNSIASQVP